MLWDLKYPANLLWYFGSLIVVWLFAPVVRVLFDKDRRMYLWLYALVLFFSFGLRLFQESVDVGQYLLFGDVGGTCTFDPLQRINPFRGIMGSTIALGYFMTGGLCVAHEDKLRRLIPAGTSLIGIFLCIAVRLLFGLMMCESQDTYYQLASNGYQAILSLVEVVLLFRLLAGTDFGRAAAGCNLVELLGKSTGGMYLIHWPLLLATRASFIAVPVTPVALAVDLVYAAALIVASLFLTWLIRHVPVLGWLVRV